ncbi:MAG TPA: DNA cytosine methyltransferase [Vitreimonas sp.]|uniref:DNA cytosine methyltransferase n=1 Tax=Vitreimonas sp. TaxID=3069702 RepID=UPI002D752E42|nr:DNA cytosine methyltransferase [Vitreimonas sp.]HYD86526.1 DNA cytosine methyltransferase [Vitreimonas sp.]
MQRDSGAPLYEFFAGGGLARLGLEPDFACVFANDIEPAKAAAYRAAFGDDDMRQGDIWKLNAGDLPGQAALAWASFPCQDLSLAGARRGLAAPRSGAFWGFHRLIEKLTHEGRAPDVLALENVTGLLSSHGGADFTALIHALDDLGYRAGALEIDASLFTPQSRPRLFIVAARHAPAHLTSSGPIEPFHTQALRGVAARLPEGLRKHFVWWRIPAPPKRNARLVDLLDDDAAVAWQSEDQTARLLMQMSPLQRMRVEALRETGRREIGAVFRRIRVEHGKRVQRAEARFDGIAGCLRTPAGGSSRQLLLFVEGETTRSRLLSPREAARLMGAPDHYPLPASQTQALHLVGDAVCVPAVRWLSQHLLAPLAGAASQRKTA